jgi:3-phytase
MIQGILKLSANRSFALIGGVILLFIFQRMAQAQNSDSIHVKSITAATGNDVDDCAIWVHPTDPAQSVVVVNDKGTLDNKGGLYVYDLSGALLQKTPMQQPLNPDIRYNVVFGPDTIDVLVCIDRATGGTTYNKVRVFKINPDKAQASSGFLTEITSGAGIPTGQTEAYGHSLYKRPLDGALFSIVSGYTVADFTQIKLESDGAGNVKGTIVRKWGGKDIEGDLCEGMCCDDELGFIYICDENACIMKYFADPDKKDNTLLNQFARKDGVVSDREGINIYRCNDTTGYILVSSQGNYQVKVYDRVTNGFKGTLFPDNMKDCDGIDVTAAPLGPKFPHGMAAFHLGSSAGSQFGFYDWSDIATGLKLTTPCDASRPHKVKTSSMPTPPAQLLQTDTRFSPLIHYFPDSRKLKITPPTQGMATVSLCNLNGQSVGNIFNGHILSREITLFFNNSLIHSGVYLVTITSKYGVHVEALAISP